MLELTVLTRWGLRMVAQTNRRWKWHASEEIIAKLAQADKILARGLSVAEVTSAIGVCDATYRRWKKLYGGLTERQVRHIRQLEIENNRMRQVIAEIEGAYSVQGV